MRMATPQPTHAGAEASFRADAGFMSVLRARVQAQLAGRLPSGDPRLHRKAAIIIAWFALSYAAMLLAPGAQLWLPAAVSLGLAAAALGLNVFHDANHGAFSARPERNLAIARLASLVLGASRHLWRYKHHTLHHRFTNLPELDDDLESRGVLRFSPHQPWSPWHRFQHRYFPLAYALNTIEWFFVKDLVQYATLRMNRHQRIPRLRRAAHVEFWLTKLGYIGLFVVLPVMALGWAPALGALVVFHMTFGLVLTLVFNLAHLTEHAEHPPPPASTAAAQVEWAAHQLLTTANFGTGNRLLNWFAGGLNFQVEHHLFPGMSHSFYPEISPVVRATATEFGLPYHEHPTWREAVRSHARLLHALAARPASVPAGLA